MMERKRAYFLVCAFLSGLSVASPSDLQAEDRIFAHDGHLYDGKMADGNFHGQGEAVLKDGTTLEGQWDTNRFVRGAITRYDGATFQFEGNLTYVFHRLAVKRVIGDGTASFPDGSKFTGFFNQFGLFHGEGTLTSPDGTESYGLWKDNRLVKPKQPYWQTTTFEAEGLDGAWLAGLRARIHDGTYKKITSLVVIKNGKILVEEYFNGASQFTLHNVESVGKSFASALIGIAVDRGAVESVDEKLISYFPDLDKGHSWDPRKEDISIRHLLTMSFGLAGDETTSYFGRFANYGRNWINDVLQLPLDFVPGSQFEYSSAATRFCAPIVAISTGMPATEFAEKYLFDPLDIDMYEYPFLPDGQPSIAGIEGIMARDLAKFGQLYLNGGTWNGRRILSQAWVTESTTEHLRIDPYTDVGYGYYFWIRNNWPIGDRRVRTYFASGLGGNKIFVFPNHDIVVVITATAYQDSYAHPQVNRLMEDEVLPTLLPR